VIPDAGPRRLPAASTRVNRSRKAGNPQIRDKLRTWEAEHGDAQSVTQPLDTSFFAQVGNDIGRAQGTQHSAVDSILGSDHRVGGDLLSGLDGPDDEAATVGVDSRQPGDLVELRFVTLH
jgi:hypothetical protein